MTHIFQPVLVQSARASLLAVLLLTGCGAWVLADESATPSPAAATTAVADKLPTGLVYFVGSVERVVGSSAIVDLGDVHSLQAGARVAVFRGRDNQYRPLGTLTVANSRPTWMQSEPVGKFTPEIGDQIVFIRSVSELGTGPAMQNRFLADQRIANQNRNGYSTIRRAETARSLMDLRLQQPRWVQFDRRISGVVLGETQGGELTTRVKRLLNQINLFRQLEEQGLPAAEAAGPEWKIVMSILQARPTALQAAGPAGQPAAQPPQDAAATDAATQPAAGADEADVIPIVEVRTMVARVLFDRSDEERAIATAMAVALLRGQERNETQWLRRQLAATQFPGLSSDEQFQVDVALVLRRMREGQ